MNELIKENFPIGGWLLFFILMGVGGIIWNTYLFNSMIFQNSSLNEEAIIICFFIGIDIFISAFIFYRLYFFKQSSSVQYIKWYLIAKPFYMGFMFMILYSVLPILFHYIIEIAGTALNSVIWYLYFSQSKRVQNTYGLKKIPSLVSSS